MKQVNVKKLILPNIPYVFIALLATKVSEAVRLAPGSDASAKLLNIMTGLNTAFHSLVPSFHPIDLCVGAAADDQDIFVPRRFRVFGAAIHRQPLRLRENDVVLKRGIDVGLDVLGGSP